MVIILLLGHFFTGGERNMGYVTFVWQEQVQMRVTQTTHAFPQTTCLLCQDQGSLLHRCVIYLSQGKTYPPI